ncbi:MAG: tetratricopeptide repeat protein [Pseudomonadota bacterium]
MTLLTRFAVTVAMAVALATPASAQSAREVAQIQSFLELVERYYQLIESTYQISDNPEMAAILQMQKIQEAYEDTGNKALAQDVFRRVLKESGNQTIRNAAFLMLGDSLKETGRTEEAVEVYQRALEENVKKAAAR